MAKYHVNSKGEPGVCKANVSCPYGDLKKDHFPSKDAAREAYEAGKLDDVFATLKKNTDEVLNETFDPPDRWCSTCKHHGGHHTDGHDEFMQDATLATDEEILAGAEKAGWATFDPTLGPEQFDPMDEAPEGWGRSTDELLMEMADEYESERQEKISALAFADDYFNADDDGQFADKNYEATEEDLAYGQSHTVLEAVGNNESLRGFTTVQLFDQLSTMQNPNSRLGRKNLSIRSELNERFTGFSRLKPVVLRTGLDYSDAYDMGRFHETTITNSEDHKIADSFRSKSLGALEASQENVSLSGFKSKELISSLSPLAAQTPDKKESLVQARITNELKLRLKGEEFIPEGEETPF